MSDEIVPDTKNWTWVLERPCEDCGFDAPTFDPAATGACIRDLSRRWQEVLARTDVATRPRPCVWSPLEYGCHVRDVFALFDRLLALMLAEDGPHFENWDQDRTAVERDYASQQGSIVAGELVTAAASGSSRRCSAPRS